MANEPCIHFIDMCNLWILLETSFRFIFDGCLRQILTCSNGFAFKFVGIGNGFEARRMVRCWQNQHRTASMYCAYESHLGFQGNVKRTRTRNLRAKTAINEANMFHTQNIEKSISYAALELSRCNKLLFNNQNRNRWFYFQ